MRCHWSRFELLQIKSISWKVIIHLIKPESGLLIVSIKQAILMTRRGKWFVEAINKRKGTVYIARARMGGIVILLSYKNEEEIERERERRRKSWGKRKSRNERRKEKKHCSWWRWSDNQKPQWRWFVGCLTLHQVQLVFGTVRGPLANISQQLLPTPPVKG